MQQLALFGQAPFSEHSLRQPYYVRAYKLSSCIASCIVYKYHIIPCMPFLCFPMNMGAGPVSSSGAHRRRIRLHALMLPRPMPNAGAVGQVPPAWHV